MPEPWKSSGVPPVTRRTFLGGLAGVGAATVAWGDPSTQEPTGGRIMTVSGPIPPDALGRTLIHEHVVVDFIGASRTSPERFDTAEAYRLALPHLKRLRGQGVSALVECTPRHIGRRPTLLKQLAEASGMHLLTNTGWYAAVDHKYLPPEAGRLSASEIGDRWLAEWREGIDETGIRPGFLKLGTGSGPLPPVDSTLLTAAARVHRETGLAIFVHTGDGAAARDEVRILRENGVAPEALVWVHAQNDPGPIQLELARLGVWISLDGYSLAPPNALRYPTMASALRDAGLLHRLLLSHDDGWAVEGDAPSGNRLTLFGNGNPSPYESVFTRLVPDLRRRGFSEADLTQVLVTNPREVLTLRRRLTS